MGIDRASWVWETLLHLSSVNLMRINSGDLTNFCRQLLQAAGVDDAQAETLTDNLVWCDMAGRRNHGVQRLPILLRHVEAKTIKCPSAPRLELLGETLAHLDADQSFGHHAGRLAIDQACDLAAAHGVGIVGVTNSSFFGAGAYYANRAAERGMISLVLSNSFPKVAAPGGLRALLGTNPFTFGAPRRAKRALLVDLSTASVAGSSVREKAEKGELFPDGIAIDDVGNPIHDPNQVLKGTLLPAAGPKGFGIALMVEVLSAALTGAAMSRQVGSMYKNFDRPGANGHFMMALDVTRWMPVEDFFDRMDLLAQFADASGSDNAVRMPGDARWVAYQDSLKNGIVLEPATMTSIADLAQSHGLTVPWESSSQQDDK